MRRKERIPWLKYILRIKTTSEMDISLGFTVLLLLLTFRMRDVLTTRERQELEQETQRCRAIQPYCVGGLSILESLLKVVP